MSWHYKETASIPDALINYGHFAYSHLWYAWVVVCVQYYFLSVDLFSLIMFMCCGNILYILLGIRNPSLPVLILYLHVPVSFLFLLFSFTIFTNLMVWKLKLFHINALSLSPLFPQCFGTCLELLHTFLCCHLWTPFCSGFCTVAQNDLLWHTLHSSDNLLDIYVDCLGHCSIYSHFVSSFCLPFMLYVALFCWSCFLWCQTSWFLLSHII